MDPRHTLLDVFEAALDAVRPERAAHTAEQLDAALDAAIEDIATRRASEVRNLARQRRAQLVAAVAEWDRTRAPVRVGWDR